MVVLLLIVAVQKEPNDQIIANIRSLDPKTQRDLMYFIKTSQEKLKSINDRRFTSGEYSARNRLTLAYNIYQA